MNLFIFGYGYTAQFIAALAISSNINVVATSRNPENYSDINTQNMLILDYNSSDAINKLLQSEIILTCIPPKEQDPVLKKFQELLISNRSKLKWVGYLSSTGVYGDHNGAWVDESADCINPTLRSKQRLMAEQQWLELFTKYDIPVHIFRLSGIYGPNRNQLKRIIDGKEYSIVKPNHFFSRIHVEDISRAILASIYSPTPGEVYNISDDEPQLPEIVDSYAAKLLHYPKLTPIYWDKANLSPMALEFYQQNKRVSNSKIKKNLQFTLKYPSYIEGLNKEYHSISLGACTNFKR